MFAQRGKLSAPSYDAERLKAVLTAEDLACLVVTSPENVYYLSGYPTLPTSGNPILYSLRNVLPYSLVIGADGARCLLCWDFSVQDVDVDVEHLVTFNERTEALSALVDVVQNNLKDNKSQIARVGIESSLPYSIAGRLRETIAGVEFGWVDEALEGLRRIKSEPELALLRQSVEIAEAAVERVLDSLKVGSSRLDMMALAKRTVIDLGGDGVGHVTMSFGHANPEIAINETLEAGDLVVADVGAKLRGYTSDCRRYGFAGAIPNVVIERHQQMCDIVAAVGDALHPGVAYADLMAVARSGFEAAGVPLLGRFTHVGHGIGLETEEEWLDDRPDRAIEAGMVIAIELYADTGGYGTIGDEETYIVRDDGSEQLTRLDTALRGI